jgi:hypothetical protein
VKDQPLSAARKGGSTRRPPWLTRDVADAIMAFTGTATLAAAFDALTPQATAYIREVRAQYRSDVRERSHTVTEADLPHESIDRIVSARQARQTRGAGGGRHRHREARKT